MTATSTPRILILDDDAFMLTVLSHTLANIGFPHVTGCDNGHEALRQVDSDSDTPDIILCDLNMPGMDGIEFLRKLVDHHYRGSLILISGESERLLQTAEILVRAHGITLLGCLRKPAQPAELATQLANWTPSSPANTQHAPQIYSVDELRHALNQQQLVIHYQPKVAVANGQLVGVEALVRWHHPRDGLIYPDQFIAIDEEHGLIDQLTQQVLIAALDQARKWQDAGLELQVAINISMENLASLSFADFVTEHAARAGVAPNQIVLEITESRLMSDARAPLEILTRLSLKRFRLSIDDFGTGNSTFSQLYGIPFDELKIDRAFVHGAKENDTIAAIFHASYGLAKQLKMEVVAEGVENQADWDFLAKNACDQAQGYFIARPMPGADLQHWIQDWQTRARQLTQPLSPSS